ncbi:MAG: MaoC family dehydratase [Colwellia sp.]|nr:MaoC family dehydratase [Colwellia sp.]
MITFDDINIGDCLPVLSTEKISRTTLALYAGASGDYNPIHIDIDFAKSAGMDDVFAHGMLSMAYLGRLLTHWVDQRSIQKIDVRFTAITPLFAQIICTGVVQKKQLIDEQEVIEVLVEAKDFNSGEIKISGIAIINLTENRNS